MRQVEEITSLVFKGKEAERMKHHWLGLKKFEAREKDLLDRFHKAEALTAKLTVQICEQAGLDVGLLFKTDLTRMTKAEKYQRKKEWMRFYHLVRREEHKRKHDEWMATHKKQWAEYVKRRYLRDKEKGRSE